MTSSPVMALALALALTLTQTRLAPRCICIAPRLVRSLLALTLSLDGAAERGVLNDRWTWPSLPSSSSTQQCAVAYGLGLAETEGWAIGLLRRPDLLLGRGSNCAHTDQVWP
jgi:hypothetical protein